MVDGQVRHGTRDGRVSYPKAHTWIRLAVSVVVCACAVGTYWYKTHPDTGVRYKVIQVKQGDGYLTEEQCRKIERGNKISSLREKYGVPAGSDNSDYDLWSYPLREDHARHCRVSYMDWWGPIRKGDRVTSVDLELVH